MRQLRVAFWNVENLFAAGTVDRGPQTEDELRAKLRVLADTIDSFFGGCGPDLLGLAEVGTLAVLDLLLERLNGEYVRIWEAPSRRDETGIALCGRRGVVADLERLRVQRPVLEARPRWLACRCALHGAVNPFIVVVTHWKSDRPGGIEPPRHDRLESARLLADFLSQREDTPCALVIGDFNVRPTEAPFADAGLGGHLHFNSVFTAMATTRLLYNTAWRFVCEPDYYEDTLRPNYQEPRPKTSFGEKAHDAILDQLLVSGRALRGGPLSLRERTVCYHHDQWTELYTPTGALRPREWRYHGPSDSSGASDHFPLLAEFVVNEEVV